MYNSASSRHTWRLVMNRGNNRIGRGPAWAEEPFYKITHKFWPDVSKLRAEAEALRESEDHRLVVNVLSLETMPTM